MIGHMIAKIRKEKGLTKTELARLSGIDLGHITHIENGERRPSHKSLKKICQSLDIPYQQLMYTYDKCISEEQVNYGFADHIAYDKVIAVDNFKNLIDCPSSMPSASIALKMPDNSMEPIYKKNEYLFIEFNSPLENNDIGIFKVKDKFFVRIFSNIKNKITLKAKNADFPDIQIDKDTNFYIIGKILNK